MPSSTTIDNWAVGTTVRPVMLYLGVMTLMSCLSNVRQPEFDVFWQMVADIDVLVYFHPRHSADPVEMLLFVHALWLSGPS